MWDYLALLTKVTARFGVAEKTNETIVVSLHFLLLNIQKKFAKTIIQRFLSPFPRCGIAGGQ